MGRSITTRYGTRINVEGLSPEQVAKVRSTAEDKGAYGAKGAALAQNFRQRNSGIPGGPNSQLLPVNQEGQPQSNSFPMPANPSQMSGAQPHGEPTLDSALQGPSPIGAAFVNAALPQSPSQSTLDSSQAPQGTVNLAGNPSAWNKNFKTADGKVRSQAEYNQYLTEYNNPATDPARKAAINAQWKFGSTTGTTANGNNITGGDLGIKGNGTIDVNKAAPTLIGSANNDSSRTFGMMNPGNVTDAGGNTRSITTDPTTGETSISTQGGAGYNAISHAFVDSVNGFDNNGAGDRSKAQDANYGYITRNYAQQKQQDQDAAKQQLSQRGIPLDSDPNSLWGRTMQQIDQKYQTMDDQAHQQAITTGNQTYQTDVNAVGTLGNTLQGQNPTDFPQYQGGSANITSQLDDLMNMSSAAFQAKYGQDQATLRAKISKAPAAAPTTDLITSGNVTPQ